MKQEYLNLKERKHDMCNIIAHAIIATVRESSTMKRYAQYAEVQVAEIKNIYLGLLKAEIKIYDV